MKRIAILVALAIFAFPVSTATSWQSGSSQVVATALAAGDALAHQCVQCLASASGAASHTNVGEFLGCVARGLLRDATAAVITALMSVSVRSFAGA